MRFIIPILCLCAGFLSVVTIFVMQESDFFRQIINLFKEQPLELRAYLAFDKIAADSIVGALPPIIWFWAFTVYVMQAPNEEPLFDDNIWFVKIFKSVIISPLSSLLFLLCGAMVGAACIIYNDTGLLALTVLVALYALLVGSLAYGVRFSTYFNMTRDNWLGNRIYNNKRKLSFGFFGLGAIFYFYSLVEPFYDAAIHIHNYIVRTT
ncbi:hypothetical protein EYS14_12570 [Alteromonadaceae bacterium M269]|nr:hypothetical protein EYS14_12570 [Alteromonadaceae bacterium M269]